MPLLRPTTTKRDTINTLYGKSRPATGVCMFVDWEHKANDVVALLHMDAGSHPDAPLLSALVDELSVKSEEFRRLWATHDVKEKCHGIQRLRHPLVSDPIPCVLPASRIRPQPPPTPLLRSPAPTPNDHVCTGQGDAN